MEKVVFKSKYVISKYNAKTEIITSTYLPETSNMLDNEWKALMKELLEVVKKYKPRCIIDDNINRKYAYSHNIQLWTLKLITQEWSKNGVKKYVQITPKNIINKLSGEQILELAKIEFSNTIKNKIVENYNEAILWINNNE